MPPDNLALVQRQSMQDLPDAKAGEYGSGFWTLDRPASILPPYGTKLRDRQLREFYHHDSALLVRSTFAGMVKKVTATPWEIQGGRNLSKRFQAIFQEAHFGEGWTRFLSRVLLDFLRQDIGGIIEVIAPGDPTKPIRSAITGVAALDALRCLPTGDPEYPIIYYDRKGRMYRPHGSRILQILDMPDNDERYPGYGDSVLSRAISVWQRQVYQTRFIAAQLDDMPPPGFVIASNLKETDLQRANAKYMERKDADQPVPWGNTYWLYSVDPAAPAELQVVEFSKPPANWSWREYNDIDADMMALAMGTDRQEIMQLTGGNIGSAAQSEILHAKSQGKMFGYILTTLTRALNLLLPESGEFAFKTNDAAAAQETAQTAQLWAGFTASVSTTLTPNEQRRLLMNQVEAYADVVTDENGELIRLNDVDPKADEQAAPDVEAPEATATDDTPMGTDDEATAQDDAKAAKIFTIEEIEREFTNRVKEAFDRARGGELNRRQFGILMRNYVAGWSRNAYQAGLANVGIADAAMSAEDEARVFAWTAKQSQFVTNLGEELFKRGGISDAQADHRPSMWFNMSIMPMYYDGQQSGNQNAYFQWMIGKTEQHCKDCLTLNGQIHRMREWAASKWKPRSPVLECKGYECDCSLVRVDRKRGRGKLPPMPDRKEHEGHNHE